MLLHAATKKSPPLISITSLPGLGKPGGQQEHDANLPRPSRQDGGKRKLSLSASHSAVSCPPALKRPSLGIAASQQGKTPKRKDFLPEPRCVQRTSLDRTPGRGAQEPAAAVWRMPGTPSVRRQSSDNSHPRGNPQFPFSALSTLHEGIDLEEINRWSQNAIDFLQRGRPR